MGGWRKQTIKSEDQESEGQMIRCNSHSGSSQVLSECNSTEIMEAALALYRNIFGNWFKNEEFITHRQFEDAVKEYAKS